jgi:hypothetical protein
MMAGDEFYDDEVTSGVTELREAHRITRRVYHEEMHPSLGPWDECHIWPCDPDALAPILARQAEDR